MLTAAAYIRVSTDDQLEFSPDSQLKLIQEYAEKSGITLLEEYIYTEEEGRSGKSYAKRERFLEMIACAKKKPKPFDVILLWKFSRFARNQEEAITLKSMLKKNGIEVISISEPLPEGPFGELIERILEWQDEYYLTNLSQEVKRGMKEKASRGEPVVPPPIGYDLIDGKYIPNQDAEFVKGVFADYLAGLGFRAIATKYASLGLKTKRGNPPDNRFIEYMLRNPVYAGKIRWSTEGRAASKRQYDAEGIMIVDGKHEAIISGEVFDAVQERIAEQKKRYGKYQRSEQSFGYMLKGLIRCSNCGATLVLVNTKSPSLQCHNYARGACTVSHSTVLNNANRIITEFIQQAAITGNFNVNTKSNERSSFEIDYDKLINNEKSKLERIKNAYQSGVDTLEEYKLAKSKITKQIKKYESAMEKESKSVKIDKNAYQNKLLSVYKILSDSKQSEAAKNTALRSVVEKIIYRKPENKFEVYFYE